MTLSDHEPIAVIGMACRFPGDADSPSKLWDLMQSPRNLSKRVPADRFDTTGFHHVNGSRHGATDATNAYFIEEDISKFDNSFFNIQPAEAEAIDPQQRLVMETVYDSLCAGGQTIENLRGSKAAVYVGMMCDDWSQIINRDWDLMPTYAATGESRAIISNRVSYFFDWHGPSMTIDTACSSSLVAVHQAVTALRNGECPIAIAAGANLILAPGMFIAESNLHMLSPTGSSKMWDAAADGYARGEGIASVVLKPLSAALRDGDKVDCIIRGTAVNQDGKTAGLTMPSNIAQTELIRDAYARAGLDINDPKDRPQFFHAHGTGTPAGDPQEAEAISRSFFDDGENADKEKLWVGSIKTVIGHTEGAAGLASFIGSVMAMQHGTIPPNMHFHNLSARVAPFFKNLQIPTSATPWPETLPGQPRRVSVNSFGFGGTNSHAVIEYYPPKNSTKAIKAMPEFFDPVFTPLTVSASSATTLRSMLGDLSAFLKKNPATSFEDLAYTLHTRRSTLGYRMPIVASNIAEAVKRMESLIDDQGDSNSALTTKFYDVANPKILGVFTGQGAQWPRMGARLLEESPFAARRIAQLQRALATLPEGDRPEWTLISQLLAPAKASRLDEAAISQPLCTAVQIVLVDLLRAANIKLHAVVGHSSGEIAAAYAAGFLTAENAIRVAYYRGLYAKLACERGAGAMLAAGTSFEDAQELCDLDDFVGRIQVAARNSLTSITLSGDEAVVDEAVEIFQDESKFARRLRIDTAYHSVHMLPCAEPYLAGLARSGYSVLDGNDTKWYSSVVAGGHVMTKEDVGNAQYWVDNMTSAVLFEPAVAQAVTETGSFDMAIETGPHPALKGPALDTIQAKTGKKIPYTGLLARGKDDVKELASAVGYLWTNLGASALDFEAFDKKISGAPAKSKRNMIELPTYPFDHSRSFYTMTRVSGSHRHVHAPPHPILGRRMVETETSGEIAWRNVLRPAEISWLSGHGLQGQSVFPATGYVSLSVEAANIVAGDRKLGLVTLENVTIGRALAFDDENASVETKVRLSITHSNENELSGRISCHSGLPSDSGNPLALNFNATLHVAFHEAESDTLPATRHEEINLVDADLDRLYSQFAKLGYNYSSPFAGVRSVKRKLGWAVGELEDESGDTWEDQLLVHPGWLDSAIQTGFAAYSHPHDNRLFALCVPTSVRSIVINPHFFDTSPARNRTLQYQTSSREAQAGHMMVDIDIFNGDSSQEHPFVQFEAAEVRPFAAPTPRDDAVLYTRHQYHLAKPDATVAMEVSNGNSGSEGDVLLAAERVSFYHLRRLEETITQWEKADALVHHQHLLAYAARTVETVSRGEHPHIPSEAVKDSSVFIRSLIAKHYDSSFMQLLETAGDHLVDEVRKGDSLSESLNKDGLLDTFYQRLTAEQNQQGPNDWYAQLVRQVAFRNPRMRILEIGNGTNTGSTASILAALGDAFSMYTYMDQSSGETFNAFQDQYRDNAERMAFASYDSNQSLSEQGLGEASHDVILLSSALYSSGNPEETLAHARQLLRPGGYLIALVVNTNSSVSLSTVMGGSLPGWWDSSASGHNDLKTRGPAMSLDEWDALTRQHGFGGIDTHTPFDSSTDKPQWFSVIVSQSVDDRVLSLRTPLTAPISAQSNNQLVIVGGRTAPVGRLAVDVLALLSSNYADVTRIESLEDLNTQGLASGTTVLSLTELEEQYLEVRTADKHEALKVMLRSAGSVLWVTRNVRGGNAFSAIMLGVCRVVRHEYPTVNLQLLDFDDATETTPRLLAESLVRLELSARFKREDQSPSLLWSMEPEHYYVNGRLELPRLLPFVEANKRYNTYRRAVDDKFDPRETTLVLEPSMDEKTFELATVSPLLMTPVTRTSGKPVNLQVQLSLLQVIKIGQAGYFTLSVGIDTESGQRVMTLADTAVHSRTRVPAEWTLRLPAVKDANIGSTILAVAIHLLAQSIIASSPRFGTVLVHEADELLKDALDKEATREGVRVVFTTAIKGKVARADKATSSRPTSPSNDSSPYVFVHDKLPVRRVQALLPRDISFLVDLSRDSSSASSSLLARCFSSHTVRAKATATEFLRPQPGLSEDATTEDVGSIGRALRGAWQAVTNQGRRSAAVVREKVALLPLADVSGRLAVDSKLTVVDWNTPSAVRALVRPIDHGNIFRADGTYLLVGLTGELGQSLCTWMVAHGARNLVLSSRKPKVSQRFIDSCATEGATVKAVPIDVVNRNSLRAALKDIYTEMPPVIGVANGAMLMADGMFDDLTFESLQRTAPPKIDGTVILDEFFYDAPLDFFITFTSLANAVGNPGQAAYVMANQFMAALSAQRRDVRGVAGSDIAMSSLQGLGYFEHANHIDKDRFVNNGYRDVSEQDFHTLFAEAVLAGRPGAKGSSEVCTGVSPFRHGAVLLGNPCFSHMVLHDVSSQSWGGGRGGANTNERPRARVAAAATREEAFAVVQEASINRLKRILMIPAGEEVNQKITLVEQGVDSIMAVELRTWLLQEFEVDLPVLKILGAASTFDLLLEEIMNLIPKDIFDLDNPNKGEKDATAAAPVAAPVAAPIPIPVHVPAAPAVPTVTAQAPAPAVALPAHVYNTSTPATGTSSTGSDSGINESMTLPSVDTPLETPMQMTDVMDFYKTGAIIAHEKRQEAERRKDIIESSTVLDLPMTLGQKGFWFLNHYINDPTTFNIALQFKITGSIRIDDLAQAVESVAQRHEALRTRYFWSSGENKTPMQSILSKPLVRLETARIGSEAEAEQELDAMRENIYNLGEWAQLRLRLLSLSDTHHYFLMGTHHISMDGHSMTILLLDINQAYNRRGTKSIEQLPEFSQARAFHDQQLLARSSGKLQPAIDYYRRVLQSADLSRPVELLSFARSQVRQPLEGYSSHVSRVHFDAQTAAGMKKLARSHRATSFHGYLTALQTLLFRLLPAETTDKLVVGIADANRLDSKFMGSIGNFLNVLPLLFNRSPNGQAFGTAVEKTRETVYSGLEHSALPFDMLLDELSVPRSNAYPPLCQVLMDYKLISQQQAEMKWAGCEVEDYRWHSARGPYDIAIDLAEDRNGVTVTLHMQQALYTQEATDLFLKSYANMVKEVVKHSNQEVGMEKLEKWDRADVNKALKLGKGADLPQAWPATLAHHIDDIIAKNADRPAVKDGYGKTMTYAEFDKKIEVVARALREKLPDQNREQSVVGVFQRPAVDWMVSLVAILRVGAVYLPLDIKASIARLQGYVKATNPAVILADNTMIDQSEELISQSKQTPAVINVSNLPAQEAGKGQRIPTAAQQDRPAYIIFTSGSTGEPKGVVIKHASIRSMVEGYVREWNIASLADVVLQQFALTSDGSLKQIFSALATGGCLLVAPTEARGDPTELTRLLAEHSVTMTAATPSEYSMWFRFAPDNLRRCKSWKAVWFGGERSPKSLLDSFRGLSKVLPDLRFLTTYGPTEASVSTMKGVADMTDPNLKIPVPGRPLPNYAVYIMDEEMRPVPVGVPGEIFIGGAGVGKNEYLNRPELTAKQFPEDPYVPYAKKSSGWGRMYCTGDYGRLDSQGFLAIEGRVAGDAQVKVRGFRVELAEIEGVIIRESAGAVNTAVVTLRTGDGDHDGILVAHVEMVNYKDVDEGQTAKIIDRLSTRLSACLPNYMVPAIIVPIADMPLTSNGKTDRKVLQMLPLPEVKMSAVEQEEQQKSFTSTERRLADLWATILPAHSLAAKPMTPRSDFFLAGGNSLLLVKLQAVIRRAFGDSPRLTKLMNTTRLDNMAILLENEGAAPDWDKETTFDSLDQVVNQTKESSSNSSSDGGLRVLVTGATGSLGKRTIPHLAANKNVSSIIALVRPVEGRDTSKLFTNYANKVQIVSADLPTLPVDSSPELLTNIDVILHIAADRNFWDGYGALKQVNVNTAKTLADLALRTGARLHVLSSGALSEYQGDDDKENLPQPDPAHGYVASKWVAERYLASAVRQTGLQVTAHRPTKIDTTAESTSEDQLTETEEAVARSYLDISPRLGVRPDNTNFGGTFYFAPVDKVASTLVKAVTESYNEPEKGEMSIVNYPGTAAVRAEVVAAHVDKLFSLPENKAILELPTVPALHWVGMAKRAGLYEWFITSQELVITDNEGRKVVSKR